MMARRITEGDTVGEPLFRQHGKQVAALCWRIAPALQVLLITSLNSRRWIFPKGWPESGLTLAESAAREAFEEAGITGKIDPSALGSYHYLKDRKDGGAMPCSVDVFALEVTKQLDDWPEKGARELAWLPLAEAAAKVGEPGLREILRDFGKHLPRARRHA
jgi:8-oxo-dGTP pyrophosphatase MutT (NUDIX family)